MAGAGSLYICIIVLGRQYWHLTLITVDRINSMAGTGSLYICIIVFGDNIGI
jgi:hypothetical protein